jgi:hypothetical protein
MYFYKNSMAWNKNNIMSTKKNWYGKKKQKQKGRKKINKE